MMSLDLVYSLWLFVNIQNISTKYRNELRMAVFGEIRQARTICNTERQQSLFVYRYDLGGRAQGHPGSPG